MSYLKTGLMYSPLTSHVYYGRMNTKTGIAVGNNKKDVTSDFIGIMLQKFEINTRQNIECNGKVEAVVIVVDEEKARKYSCSNEMYEAVQELTDFFFLWDGGETNNQFQNDMRDKMEKAFQVLAKARGDI